MVSARGLASSKTFSKAAEAPTAAAAAAADCDPDTQLLFRITLQLHHQTPLVASHRIRAELCLGDAQASHTVNMLKTTAAATAATAAAAGAATAEFHAFSSICRHLPTKPDLSGHNAVPFAAGAKHVCSAAINPKALQSANAQRHRRKQSWRSC
jgi:hypothetical protein